MATLDIFNDDAFQLTELSQTIIDIPRVPTLLGDLGVFTESGMTGLTFMIERQGSSIKVLPTAPRGGVREPVALGPRKLFPLAAFHIPATWSVMADEVQGVRAFGSTTEVMQVKDIVKQKLDVVKGSFDLTHEWQRVGALKGLVKDADGSTLLDLYDAFDMTQTNVAWDLSGSGDPKVLAQNLKFAMQAKMGGRSFARIRVICSLSFFQAFVGNAKMAKAWDLWNQGQFYRDDQTNSDFVWLNGQFAFTIYNGMVGETPMLEDGYAYAYPEGVPGLFQSKFAPADYMETVNTVGLPYYAKQEPMAFNKGVVGESQSNPLHYCSLPEAVFKLHNAAS